MGKSVYLEPELYHSKAFHKLSGKSLHIYIFFLSFRRMEKIGRKGKESWICKNNGQIEFTYSRAEKLGFTKREFTYALDKLTKLGFIDIEHQGGGLFKEKSQYTISDRWKKWSTPDFKEQKRKKRSREQGYAKSKNKK